MPRRDVGVRAALVGAGLVWGMRPLLSPTVLVGYALVVAASCVVAVLAAPTERRRR